MLAACGDSEENTGNAESTENNTTSETAASEANQELNWALGVDPDGLDPHMTTQLQHFKSQIIYTIH